MTLKIAKQFQVRAPVDAVFRFLLDPRRALSAMPGAELTEVKDEKTFLGSVKVKVGPVTVSYKGEASILEVDEATHTVRLLGEGKEAGSAGSVKALMVSRVTELPGGLSQVDVDADVDLTGKIVQFGRGMIDQVTEQLFARFVAGVRAQLEGQGAAAAAPAASAAGAAGTGARAAQSSASGPPSPASAGTSAGAGAGSLALSAGPAALAPAAEPIRILPILLRALATTVANFFRRLFGRAAK